MAPSKDQIATAGPETPDLLAPTDRAIAEMVWMRWAIASIADAIAHDDLGGSARGAIYGAMLYDLRRWIFQGDVLRKEYRNCYPEFVYFRLFREVERFGGLLLLAKTPNMHAIGSQICSIDEKTLRSVAGITRCLLLLHADDPASAGLNRAKDIFLRGGVHPETGQFSPKTLGTAWLKHKHVAHLIYAFNQRGIKFSAIIECEKDITKSKNIVIDPYATNVAKLIEVSEHTRSKLLAHL